MVSEDGSAQRRVNMYGIRGVEVRRGLETCRELKWKPLYNGSRMGLPRRCHAVASPGRDVVLARSTGRTIRLCPLFFPTS